MTTNQKPQRESWRDELKKELRDRFRSKYVDFSREMNNSVTDGHISDVTEYDIGQTLVLVERIVFTQRTNLLGEVRELVQTNQKGQFEEDTGEICWYLDDLLSALTKLEED